jgi:hypothetical protein
MSAGEKAIDAVVAHWKQVSEVRKTDVPEWNQVVYHKPFNMQERQKIALMVEQAGEYAAAVETVILKALDKSGERLFTVEDRKRLLVAADPSVVGRLSYAIAMPAPTVEDAAGN